MTCISSSFEVTVLEDLSTPAISASAVMNNSNCSPMASNGSIQIEALTDGIFSGGGYTITGSGAISGVITATGDGSTGNPFLFSNLEVDSYTIIIEDNASGCTIEQTFDIVDDQEFPAFNVDANNITANTRCDIGNGSFSLTSADITTPTGAAIGDFDWELFQGTNTNSILTVVAASTTDPLVFNNLDPDTYFLQATSTATSCVSGFVEIIITDNSEEPELEVTNITPNENCTGTEMLGAISILADGEDHTTGNYSFQWFIGSDTSTRVSDTFPTVVDNEATLSGVSDGTYTVAVTNTSGSTNNGCVTIQSFDIPNIEVDPVITDFTTTPNTNCVNENGVFELLSVSLNGSTIPVATLETDFTIGVFTDQGLTSPVTDDDPATPRTFGSLAAGTYYSVVTRNSSLCASDILEFAIADSTTLPIIDIVQVQADSICSGTVGTGILTSTADGVSDTTLYRFEWRDDSNNIIASNNTIISSLLSGTYQLQVTNNTTGCVSTEEFVLESLPGEPQILDVAVTDPTACTPPNGILEVTAVSIGNVARYTFEFFDTDPNTGNPTPLQSGSSPTFSQAEAGLQYFVVGTDTLTNCVTRPFQIDISDESLEFPEIVLRNFQFQQNCNPAIPNGELTAGVSDGAGGFLPDADFTFRWTNDANQVIEVNNATVDSLAAGEYNVLVTNIATGCFSSETFTMADDTANPLLLSTSSSVNTNCVNPNGIISANVILPRRSLGEYEYFWFIGDVQNPDLNNPDFTGSVGDNGEFMPSIVTGLPGGTYTVVVRDTVDNFCISNPTTILVGDEIDIPTFEIDILSDLTICDPLRPNGLAEVTMTSNDINRFEFNWFFGSDTSATPIETGILADSLIVGDYTVVLRDLITGCVNVNTFEIIDDTPIIPTPSINIIAGRTNCQIANGIATVTADGVTDGILFEWFIEGDLSAPVFTGSQVSSLDDITYVVRATDLASACQSDFATVTIPNEIVDPLFDVISTESLCLRTEDGSTNQFSGTAFIQFVEAGNFAETIEWINSDGVVVSNDQVLIDARPGAYTVNFVAGNGCDYTAEFDISATLQVYNGVSANEDGLNDFFLVDCLDLFPNNNVQIFTRDGIKIYEIDNYDNLDNRFDGTSNIGATRQLPAGTYFFIINKGDGSELIQGFLELVR